MSVQADLELVDFDALLEMSLELDEAEQVNRPAVLCNIVGIG